MPRFGFALLASTALHVLLVLLVPGLPYSAAVPGEPDPNLLTVTLTSQAPQPSQPKEQTEPYQAVERSPAREAEAVMPTELPSPVIPATPTLPVIPATPAPPADPVPSVAHPESALVSTHSPSRPEASGEPYQTVDNANKPTVPAVNPGMNAQQPDAAQIGEEFKRTFIERLAYPEAARRRGVQGTAALRITMEGDGRISGVRVSQTSGSSVLDKAALDAALATPGPLIGPGVRLELDLRVSFKAGRVSARP